MPVNQAARRKLPGLSLPLGWSGSTTLRDPAVRAPPHRRWWRSNFQLGLRAWARHVDFACQAGGDIDNYLSRSLTDTSLRRPHGM